MTSDRLRLGRESEKEKGNSSLPSEDVSGRLLIFGRTDFKIRCNQTWHFEWTSISHAPVSAVYSLSISMGGSLNSFIWLDACDVSAKPSIFEPTFEIG